MSSVYKKIQFIRHQNRKSGLTSVKVPRDTNHMTEESMKTLPDDSHTWRTVRVPAEIEQLLLSRNQQHYGQAEGTPFTQPPLSMDCKYDGTGVKAEAILDGEYDTTGLQAPVALFINHLQRQSLETLDGTISTEDILGKLKVWPERTTTSPSGLHLGHYHAMWRPTGCIGGQEDPQGQALLDSQIALQKGHTKMMQYALKYGYSYKRWSSVVNIMLEKDAGNPRIHRLRVIHIYEADYNLILAVKWRQALFHAEDKRLLNNGLYGSRPGRSAVIPVYIENMQNSIYQLSMKSGINFDLDATACYDRILASVASIASRRMGMNSRVVLVNSTTLEQAQFRIKTTLGISCESYSHSLAFPIHGTGQGSGNSPTIWCFVCSVLFDALEATTAGAVFISPDRVHSVHIWMIGFVDDCSQRVNRFEDHPQPSSTHLVAIMQREAQRWNDLLWSSGGALELAKCSYHLIQTDWTKNGAPFLTATTNAPPLVLTNANGQQSVIRQMSNYQAHRTLGCYIDPAMTMRKQMKVLQAKNEMFTSLLRTNYLNRREAWTMYTSVYLPSMTYPFPNIVVTETESDKWDQRFMPALVSQCGYSQKMATAIRYGPMQYGGAGFRKLYVEWGVAVVLELLKSLRTAHSYQGRMTAIALSWAQQYIGTSKCFLTYPNEPIPPCPNKYFMSIRSFLASTGIQLKISIPVVAKLLRANDAFIMDRVMDQGWNKQRVESINACRRYLQATTLADITNDRGTEVLEEIWDGSRVVLQESFQGVMFNQKKPDRTAWGHWRRFMRTLCSSGRKLVNPLGSWIVPISEVRHPPVWAYDPRSDNLYKRSHGLYYWRCPRNEHQRFSDPTSETATGPASGYPTWVIVSARGTYPVQAFRIAPVPRTEGGTFHQYIQTLQEWEQSLLAHCTLLQPPDEIVQSMNMGPVTCGSDGSVRQQRATFGYIIRDCNQQCLVRGRGPAPGSCPTSLRSEAYGNLAVCRLLYRLSIFTGTLLSTTITMVVDSQSLIQRIKQGRERSYDNPTCCMQPEWDVINEILTSLRQMELPCDYKWVKSHQDSATPYHSLGPEAQINCEADMLAEEHYQYMPEPVPIEPCLPSNPAQLFIGGASITRRYKSRIREASTLPALMQYVSRRFQWEGTLAQEVAWPTFTQIIRHFPKQQTTIVKHVHAIAPTGHIAHRNQESLSPKCPSCACPYEDNNHVITCPAPSRSQWRNATISIIETLKEDQSDPILKQVLIEGLERFHQGRPGLETTNYPEKYHPLIRIQNALGWDQLYRGRWSQRWSQLHSEYASNQIDWSSQDRDGDLWVMYHGQELLSSWLKLWGIRNAERHGADAEARQHARKEVLLAELQTLYLLKPSVTPRDRHIFFPTAVDHIRARPNLDSIENWILTHRSAIQASVDQARRHGIQQTRTIQTYFLPGYTPADRGLLPATGQPQ